MYDIPATVTMLPAPSCAHMPMSPEVPERATPSFAGRPIGYFGPGATSCNTYDFEVHAMKVEKLTSSGASKRQPAKHHPRQSR